MKSLFSLAGAIATFKSRLPQTTHNGIEQPRSPAHVNPNDK